MKIAFWKLLNTEDLKGPVKDAKKMKTASCAGSPNVIRWCPSPVFIRKNKFIISLLVNIWASKSYYYTVFGVCLQEVWFEGNDNNKANVTVSESCFHSKQTTLKNVHHSSNVINSFPHCMSSFTAQCSSQPINECNTSILVYMYYVYSMFAGCLFHSIPHQWCNLALNQWAWPIFRLHL